MIRPFAAIAAVVAIGVTVGACGSDSETTTTPVGRPNFVVVMTDDQTLESIRVMTHVQELIAARGVTFEQNVVSFPLCCPSRATYLTGQYAKNNGVRGNEPPDGGYSAFRNQDTTFVAALQRAGYDTIHIGKFLNGYGTRPPIVVPPGWTRWYGGVDPTTYRYFGYTLFENGSKRTYGTSPSDYQTDVFTDLAVSEITSQSEKDTPFFLEVAYLAPHAPVGEGGAASTEADTPSTPIPAPRHEHRFDDEPLPENESFDEADVSDKPAFVQELPRISSQVRAQIAAHYDAALATLLAVDEGVQRIVDALDASDALDRTIVVFTSDNGFFYGEHRIPRGKQHFYEPSIHVPLVISGPGVVHDETRSSLVANIDLAPTMLDLADVEPLRAQDGVSLAPLLRSEESAGDRSILLESGGRYFRNWGVRTPRYAYFEHHTRERELYDLRSDPDQLVNVAGDPDYATAEADLKARLERLKVCAGPTCR